MLGACAASKPASSGTPTSLDAASDAADAVGSAADTPALSDVLPADATRLDTGGARPTFLYVGGGGTVHAFAADLIEGNLVGLGTVAAGDDARLAELDPVASRLYVQTQIGRAQAILTFVIDNDGRLTESSRLELPYPLVQGVTQISRHPTAPWFVLSATNESPGLEDQLMPVGADGRLGAHRSIAQEFYAFAWDPAGRHFFGLDGEEIFQYRFDPATGIIAANSPPRAVGTAGRTVLSLRNHPNGRWIYSVEEDALGLLAFDPMSGLLAGQEFVGNPEPAEAIYWTSIGLHPSGRFLYALGYATGSKEALVDLFRIDPTSGRLAFVHRERAGLPQGILNQGLQAPLVSEGLLIIGGPGAAGQGPRLLRYRIDVADGRLIRAAAPLALGGTGGVSFVVARSR